MEIILIAYLEAYLGFHIYLEHFEVDGATCKTEFYTDEARHFKETHNINIWDMFVFLNDHLNSQKR